MMMADCDVTHQPSAPVALTRDLASAQPARLQSVLDPPSRRPHSEVRFRLDLKTQFVGNF